jgi:CRISPR-associated protein Csb2
MGRYKRVCQERKYGRNTPADGKQCATPGSQTPVWEPSPRNSVSPAARAKQSFPTDVPKREFGNQITNEITHPADADRFVSPTFSGKDPTGNPLAGHQHAYYLPCDEDNDGRIDHFTIYAEKGFDADELAAMERLRRLPWGEGEPLSLMLVGLGQPHDFRAPPLDESAVWVSATPFIATRYPKRSGRKRDDPALRGQEPVEFARVVLGEELERLRQRRPSLPNVLGVERLEGDCVGAHHLRRIQFKRSRGKHGDDGWRRAWGAFRIVFDQPVRGPLCLGFASHFGMGLFVPQE